MSTIWSLTSEGFICILLGGPWARQNKLLVASGEGPKDLEYQLVGTINVNKSLHNYKFLVFYFDRDIFHTLRMSS